MLKNTLKSLFFLFSVIIIASCGNGVATNMELNKKLEVEHQKFLKEHQIILQEHDVMFKEYNQWEKEYQAKKSGVKDQNVNEIKMHDEAVVAQNKILKEHDDLIKGHDKLLQDQTSILKNHVEGKLIDKDFEKAHIALAENHKKLVEKHNDIKAKHEAFEDKHKTVLATIVVEVK